ncbi:potassium channel family protein [Planctomycetota bacterium]
MRGVKMTTFDSPIAWKTLRSPMIMLVIAFFGGTLGYKVIYPDQEWVVLFFQTAITISTVGYGDYLAVHESALASWYTMSLMLVGMGFVLYAISTVTAFLIEGQLSEVLLRHSTKRKIAKMHDHYIVCGCGRTGVHVVRELCDSKRPFVVIDQDAAVVNSLRSEFRSCRAITGDSSSDAVLEEANIRKAHGLVAALPTDKENLFLTVSARLLNPDLQIVSKTIDLSIRKKLMKAGANYVVCPNLIGGMRIASELLRPHVVSFLDRMLRGTDTSMRIEEVVIPEQSSADQRTLADMEIQETTGLNIIAYAPDKAGGDLVYNPSPDLKLNTGGILVFIGNPDQRLQLEELVAAS